MANRLANESSPYLLQHAENPVDWYPWCDEALEKAKAENKPIFLSIGYSACHWCHVMEHESFENAVIATFLNENFVSIKVDREERPDLDQIYMHAVMALQRGQGGWPLSAFLTPDGHVFFGGTYWPPHDSRGMPGFDRVLKSVMEAFTDRREQVEQQSAKITDYLNAMSAESSSDGDAPLQFDDKKLFEVGESLERVFDFQHGGFGRAPKFPHSMDLQVLMRLHFREAGQAQDSVESRWMKMVNLNLEKMALGGIYDHLAGGFARYSVDEKWLVPHFEKMLYDNALLSDAYVDAYSITGNSLFRDRAIETFDYQLKYMTDPSGAFYSTEDADSEGEEGKFYVWSPDEVIDVLGDDDGQFFNQVYDVTPQGNFEGKNILNLDQPISENGERLASCREKLLEARDKRVRPGLDDKVLVSWNALMIHAMAKGAMVLEDNRYLNAAVKAAEFIESEMVQADGTSLFHTWRSGEPKFGAYLDDYACYINSLVTLFECTADPRWLRRAIELVDHVANEFHDREGQGFYFTSQSSEKLIARTKEFQDSSVPSGNAMMVTALARIERLTENPKHRKLAETTAAAALELIQRAPSAAGQMICGIDRLVSSSQEIVIFCQEEEREAILKTIYRSFHPNRVICCQTESSVVDLVAESLVKDRKMIDGQSTVFVCENHSCSQPIVGMDQVVKFFEEGK